MTKKSQRVLIVNSYAGSLTIAATELDKQLRRQGRPGLDIIGSYEDARYGLAVQRANFPKLNYVEKLPWPKQDLSSTVCIGHPPCAAFSIQSTCNKDFGSTDHKKFQQTKTVLDYVLGQGAPALAIESVTGALEGARQVHDEKAKRYGYDVYRILLNAVTFGVPQWRPRFWCLFIRQGRLKELVLRHEPKVVTVGELVEGLGRPTPVAEKIQQYYDKVIKQLRSIGLRQSLIDDVLENESGRLYAAFQDRIGEKRSHGVDERRAVLQRFCATSFDTMAPTILDPAGFTPVVFAMSSFWYKGRPLSIPEYNAVMGFPPDYVFPGKKVNEQRAFLSRGVCPPIARWILEQILANLNGIGKLKGNAKHVHVLQPGETLSLLLKKEAARQRKPPWQKL